MAIIIEDDKIIFDNGGRQVVLRETNYGFDIGRGRLVASDFIEGGFFQGSVSGYTAGGLSPGLSYNTIDKFPFASDTNASDVGDLTQQRSFVAGGQSSKVSGYNSGGLVLQSTPDFPVAVNTIDKFPFATDTNASDVGDLLIETRWATGQSSSVSGYVSGGGPKLNTNTPPGLPSYNTIQKFPFATDTNTSDVGDLSSTKEGLAGQSSATYGYTSGGFNQNPPFSPVINTIEKFPFAVDSAVANVGDLTQARESNAGQSSIENGYTSGGFNPSPSPGGTYYNIIDKFPFASDANASDVGDLTGIVRGMTSQSSTASGYTSGGSFTPPPVSYNTIDKFPFATDTNASDVGDLTASRHSAAGNQH